MSSNLFGLGNVVTGSMADAAGASSASPQVDTPSLNTSWAGPTQASAGGGAPPDNTVAEGTTNIIAAVNVEISVVLGRCTLPMQQLLRMGRGAVIPLDATVNEEVWILANNHPVARGEIQINDEKISIAVTREANVYDFMAGGGQ